MIELPAVHSVYWYANRGQFKELMALDGAVRNEALPFAEASLAVGRSIYACSSRCMTSA